MVTDSALYALSEWMKAYLGTSPLDDKLKPGEMRVVRNGGGCRIRRGKSLIGDNKPMVIGDRAYVHGIVAHAESEIHVRLPLPAAKLVADIGRDQNLFTKNTKGSIVFKVDIEDREVYSSPEFQGGEDPFPIEVPLEGTREFSLRVAGEVAWGNADWSDAKVILENGSELWLDELPLSSPYIRMSGSRPFSFIYNGRSSGDFLGQWKRTYRTERLNDTRTGHEIAFTDPETGLEVILEATTYEDYPVAEWVLRFKNSGDADTPIIEDIQALDMLLSRRVAEGEFLLHHAKGSDCSAEDFAPLKSILGPGSVVALSPEGGRSSSGSLPFFNVECAGSGVIMAVGWTGQWKAVFSRDEDSDLRIRSGMELTHLKLHPGEEIRTPRIMLLFWKGDRLCGHNMLRRFMLDYHSPRPNGELVQTPICYTTWGMIDEKSHLKKINDLIDNEVPFEYYWIDAGWYGDNKVVDDWYAQAGSWEINRSLYPNGFAPISDLLHKHGKKFILWFDTERVYEGSALHLEHPEWCLGIPGSKDYLLNLGDEKVRRWITDFVSSMIAEQGIDVYRQDFNMDPLPYWRAADAPDRQGMSEIRHIESLYAFWDELLRRHPHLLIDNCSSGGRRLDLETAGRSIPLWRSDLQCDFDQYSANGNQSQTVALNYWLPLHCAGTCETGDTYDFRSAITGGCVLSRPRSEDPDMLFAWTKQMMTELTAIRKYYYGDFYPLTSYSLADDVWMAYQLNRPDLGEGIVVAYCRENSHSLSASFKLSSLRPASLYMLTNLESGETKSVRSEELTDHGVNVFFDRAPNSAVILYRLADA